MAYTQKTWVTGEVIEASELNNMETGIKNNDDGVALSKSNLATVESSSTASKAYSAGEFLVYQGILRKVTSNIAQGGTITPGTNCSTQSVGSELSSINTALTVKSHTFTSGYFSEASVVKVGNVKVLRLQTVGTNDAMDTTVDYITYFTLPVEYRPSVSYLWRFQGRDGAGINNWICRVQSDGKVDLINYDQRTHPGIAQAFAFI